MILREGSAGRKDGFRTLAELVCVAAIAGVVLVVGFAATALADHQTGAVAVSPGDVRTGEPVVVDVQALAHGSQTCVISLDGVDYSACSVNETLTFSTVGTQRVLIRWFEGSEVVGAEFHSFDVAPPATPAPVRVVNVPEVTFPTAQPVAVENWEGAPTPEADADAWGPDDSQHLKEGHLAVIHLGGVLAFGSGVGLMLKLPGASR